MFKLTTSPIKTSLFQKPLRKIISNSLGKTFSIWNRHKKLIHGKVVESKYSTTTNWTFEVKTSVIQSDATLTTIVYSWKFSIHNICIGKGTDLQDKSPDELDAWLAINLGFCLKASIFRILLILKSTFQNILSTTIIHGMIGS